MSQSKSPERPVKVYQITTLPSLAGVMAREIIARVEGAMVMDVMQTRANDISLVKYGGDPNRLLELRTAEDVFVALGKVKLTGQPADVKALPAAGLWGGPLRAALELWAKAWGRPLTKRLLFRAVVQAEDAAWRQYRRQELTLAAERALLQAGGSWRINREAAPLEVWLQQVGRELLVSLRLTTGATRQHGGRETERAAALRPSVAAAMVLLSGSDPDDVFLDPMCGTGTILLERAAAGRYKLLLGGDIDRTAVEATLANFGPRHQPRRIERWDARQLPLDDGSVSKIVCNLPWGRLVGEKAEIPALYRDFLSEAARVLIPGGRMVLLTSEWDTLKKAASAGRGLKLTETIQNVSVLGRRADIFTLTKTDH